MALSADDVRYINELMDRRLKNLRSWWWARYVNLFLGLFCMVMAGGIYWFAETLPSFDLLPIAASKAAKFSATQPVSQKTFFEMLDASEGIAQGSARLEATMAMLRLSNDLEAMVWFFCGAGMATVTLTRWNQDRRDRILITLLREKCAAELAGGGS